jgi:hypothetical protein
MTGHREQLRIDDLNEQRDPSLPPTHRVKHENPTREAIWRLDILTDAVNQLYARSGHELHGSLKWMLGKTIRERTRLSLLLDEQRAAKATAPKVGQASQAKASTTENGPAQMRPARSPLGTEESTTTDGPTPHESDHP